MIGRLHISHEKYALLNWLSLMYPAFVAVCLTIGGWVIWLNFLFGGSIYPLLDFFRKPAGSSKETQHGTSGLPTALLLGFLLVELLLIGYALHLISLGQFRVYELVGVGLALGTVTGGIGIPAAHELIHRSEKMPRTAGLLLLLPVLYMHFRIEHIYGHHRRVGTPEDPATARLSEGFWRFLPRSVWGQFKGAYHIEKSLLERSSRWLNRFWLYLFVELFVVAAIGAIFGKAALFVFLGQAIVGLIFLEAINYVEHYGLIREQDSENRLPRVAHEHSWNTGSYLTNMLTFNLGFHSHHHTDPRVPYQKLQNSAEAPQLPAGYLVMIIVAVIPPLWRRIMDRRVADWQRHRARNRGSAGA